MRLKRSFPSTKHWLVLVTAILGIAFAAVVASNLVGYRPATGVTKGDEQNLTSPFADKHVRGSSSDGKDSAVPTKVSSLASSKGDWEIACTGVDWWAIAEGGDIPRECLNALDYLFLDEGAAQYAFGMSFGLPISFRRVFSDPKQDQNRMLDALKQANCWEDLSEWSPQEHRRLCHADAFMSYSIALFLCKEKELQKWASATQDHWIRTKCQTMSDSIDDMDFRERSDNTPFLPILDRIYGRDETYPTYALLHLLAVFLGDPTALGLPLNAWLLSEKHPWRAGLILMSYQQADAFHYETRMAYGEFTYIQSLSIALDAAVGLSKLDVEPNWQNLMKESSRRVSSDEHSLQHAFLELGSALDPIDDREKLLALNRLEQVALQMGIYVD